VAIIGKGKWKKWENVSTKFTALRMVGRDELESRGFPEFWWSDILTPGTLKIVIELYTMDLEWDCGV
jgi:hypothetical protein